MLLGEGRHLSDKVLRKRDSRLVTLESKLSVSGPVVLGT